MHSFQRLVTFFSARQGNTKHKTYSRQMARVVHLGDSLPAIVHFAPTALLTLPSVMPTTAGRLMRVRFKYSECEACSAMDQDVCEHCDMDTRKHLADLSHLRETAVHVDDVDDVDDLEDVTLDCLMKKRARVCDEDGGSVSGSGLSLSLKILEPKPAVNKPPRPASCMFGKYGWGPCVGMCQRFDWSLGGLFDH